MKIKSSACGLGIVVFALFALTGGAAAQSGGVSLKPLNWRGEITGAPLVLGSPLTELPIVPEGARRLILPAPKGPVPKAALIPFTEGGGLVTLIVRWRDGWLMGTNRGEWGGALYLAMPKTRITLARGNVIGGFTWRGYLYVLSGLQHLTTDKGELWEVDLKASRLVRRIALPASPNDVIVTKDDGVIIRTGQGDLALLESGEVVPAGMR